MASTDRDGGLRKEWRTHLPQFHWTSVESPLTVQGIPDTNYCHRGSEGWIENKKVKLGSDGVVVVRPEQFAWHERRLRAGGKVFIAVRWPAKDDTLYLLHPLAGRSLVAGARLTGLPADHVLGQWRGGPSRWKWPKIAEILLSV